MLGAVLLYNVLGKQKPYGKLKLHEKRRKRLSSGYHSLSFSLKPLKMIGNIKGAGKTKLKQKICLEGNFKVCSRNRKALSGLKKGYRNCWKAVLRPF